MNTPQQAVGVSDLQTFEKSPMRKAQHVGDPEGRVDTPHEQQQVAKAPLSPQEVFDLSDPFPVANGFNKIHANQGKTTPSNW